MPPFRPALLRLAEHAHAWAAAMVVGGIALMAWSAQIAIPMQPVPITLQSYVLITLAALLGWRLGGLTVALYVAFGLAGMPVFAKHAAGLQVLTGPTGGFLVGFVLVALLVGALQQYWARGRWLPLLITLALGHLVLMVVGAGWLGALRGAQVAWEKGFLPFLPGAGLKTLAALLTVLVVERLAAPRQS